MPEHREKAVEAAMAAAVGMMEALADGEEIPTDEIDFAAAVEAARPHIEAEVRERLLSRKVIEAHAARRKEGANPFERAEIQLRAALDAALDQALLVEEGDA